MKKLLGIATFLCIVFFSIRVSAADICITDVSSNYTLSSNYSFDYFLFDGNTDYKLNFVKDSNVTTITFTKIFNVTALKLYCATGMRFRFYNVEGDLVGTYTTENFYVGYVKSVDYKKIKKVVIDSTTTSTISELDIFGNEFVPFTLESVSPSDGAKDVPISDYVVLSFSSLVDPDSLENTYIQGVDVRKEVSGSIVNLIPLQPLEYNTKYDIYVSDVRKAESGGLLNYTYHKTFTTVKETLQNPHITLFSTVRKIVVSWSSVPKAEGYNLYLNGNKVISLPSNRSTYTFEDLNPNTEYKIGLEAFATDCTSGFVEEYYRTGNYYSQKPTSSVYVTQFSALVKWSDVMDTKFYEIRLGDNPVIQLPSTQTEYKFTDLVMETEYKVYVRQVNLADVVSDWTEVVFTTLGPPEVPPGKPEKLSVIEKGQDYILVEVSETAWATSYKFYLNNSLKVTQEGRTFRFEGLTKNTQYSVSVRSSNQYGDSLFPISIIVTTNDISFAQVTRASSTWNDGSPAKQTVKWDSKGVQQGFKILVDGKPVKEYPAGTNTGELDFDELELEGNNHVIEVAPIDPGGKSYKFRTFSKGTGNQDFDKMTGKILTGNNVIKTGGMLLIYAILTFLLIFVVVLFLFNKMKLNMATNDDYSLEANPDEQIKSMDNKNKFDRDAYFTAKLQESEHQREKKEDFSLKVLLNQAVNGGKGRKKEKSYKINVKGRDVQIDKTSYYANKYGDFRKLGNETEFYQWQKKYNDFSQGSYNRYFKGGSNGNTRSHKK